MALVYLIAGPLFLVFGVLAARRPMITERLMARTTLKAAVKVFSRDRSEQNLAATYEKSMRSLRFALPAFCLLFGFVLLLGGLAEIS